MRRPPKSGERCVEREGELSKLLGWKSDALARVELQISHYLLDSPSFSLESCKRRVWGKFGGGVGFWCFGKKKNQRHLEGNFEYSLSLAVGVGSIKEKCASRHVGLKGGV